MATRRGQGAVKRYLEAIPEKMEANILRGAARAGATVIAQEVKDRAPSDDIREGIVTKARSEPGRVTVRISVKPGWARSLGIWAEYGTDPHFISVDDSQRAGRSVGRINTLSKEGELVISGQFVGKTVFHPGARAIPFIRPALDTKEAEALAAARTYVSTRLSRSGLNGSPDVEDDDI